MPQRPEVLDIGCVFVTSWHVANARLAQTGIDSILNQYSVVVKIIGEKIKEIAEGLASKNLEGFELGTGPMYDALMYGLLWAKNLLDSLGIDWKTEYPAAY